LDNQVEESEFKLIYFEYPVIIEQIVLE